MKTADVCVDEPSTHLGWRVVNPRHLGFPWEHDRNLKVNEAKEAINRIDAEVAGFPFQIRYAMALPLWYRYAAMYCETGDQEKALAEI